MESFPCNYIDPNQETIQNQKKRPCRHDQRLACHDHTLIRFSSPPMPHHIIFRCKSARHKLETVIMASYTRATEDHKFTVW